MVAHHQGKLGIVDLFEIVLVGFQHFVHIAIEEDMTAAEADIVGLVSMDYMAAEAADIAGLIGIAAAVVGPAHIDHIVGIVEVEEVEAAHMADYYIVHNVVAVAVAVGVEVEGSQMIEGEEMLEVGHKEMAEVELHTGKREVVHTEMKAEQHAEMEEVDHKERAMVDSAGCIADGGMGMDAQVRKSDLADLDHMEVDRQLATLRSVNSLILGLRICREKHTYGG